MANWTPANLATPPVAWWDPTQGMTVASGKVTAWNSRTGSATASATGTGQPSTTTVNGVTVPTFNGSSNFLTITDTAKTLPLAPKGGAIFIMASDTKSGGGAGASPISWGVLANGQRRAPSAGGGKYSNSDGSYAALPNGAISQQGYYTGDTGTTTLWGATPQLIMIVYGAGTGSTVPIQIWKNGTKLLDDVIDAEAAGGTITGLIGACINSSRTYWTGIICEIVVLDYPPATADQQSVEGYGEWKFGNQAALPSSHPYANAAPQTGTSGITGTAAIAEAADTAAGTGTIRIAATLAAPEASDLAAGVGTARLTAALAAVEADDSVAAAGALRLASALSAVESDDQASSTGALKLRASAGLIEAEDLAAGVGAARLAANADLTEVEDSVAIVGTLRIAGAAALAEDSDTVAGTSKPVARGAASLIEDPDAVSGTARLAISADAAAFEQDDAAAGAVGLSVRALLAALDGDDWLASSAILTTPAIRASAALVEDDDSLAATARNVLIVAVPPSRIIRLRGIDRRITLTGTDRRLRPMPGPARLVTIKEAP